MQLEGIEAVRAQIDRINPLAACDKYDAHFVVNAPYPDEDIKTSAELGTLENIAELVRRLRVVVRYNVISKEEEILIPGYSFSLDNGANAKLAVLTTEVRTCKNSKCKSWRVSHADCR